MIYAITLVAKTTQQNPDHGVIGEAYVVCWVESDDEGQASKIAHDAVSADHWQIITTEEISIVTAESYADDPENLERYEQALIDKTVFVCNLCPRYPVYFFQFQVADDTGQCEARVWISNEVICETHDPFESDFWTGERLSRAKTIASDTITANGFKVLQVVNQYPCGTDEADDEVKFYDEAEEDGLCVVIVHEGDA